MKRFHANGRTLTRCPLPEGQLGDHHTRGRTSVTNHRVLMARFLNYANFDDGLLNHRKFIRLFGHDDGAQAFAAWVRLVLWAHGAADPHKPAEAGCFDAAIARHVLGETWERLVALIEDARLLDAQFDGWQLHDFAEHQDLAAWARRLDNARKGGKASAAARSSTQGSPGGSTQSPTKGSTFNTQPNLGSKEPNATPLTRRAQAIASRVYDADNLIKFPAVQALAKTAISKDRWSDEEITDAMLAIVTENRPLTQETLRVQLGKRDQPSGLDAAWYNQQPRG